MVYLNVSLSGRQGQGGRWGSHAVQLPIDATEGGAPPHEIVYAALEERFSSLKGSADDPVAAAAMAKQMKDALEASARYSRLDFLLQATGPSPSLEFPAHWHCTGSGLDYECNRGGVYDPQVE